MAGNRVRKINEEIIYLNRSVTRFTLQLNELESLKAGLLTIEGQAKKIQNNDNSLDYLPSNIWEGEHANKIVLLIVFLVCYNVLSLLLRRK